MKPITYWVQNEVINRLVDDYGSHFEALTPGSRRHFIACLASGIHYWEGEDKDVDWLYAQTEKLTRQEKDYLIEAIAANLTYVCVTHRQKTGTPSH